jgi:SIR2-like domain
MIDPMLSLAFSLYSNKGAYALLLGSGISRGAGIPTGWEVITDLIQKIAVLKGEKIEGDPAGWFIKKFNEEPNYSFLIKQIAKTPEERKGLLKGYFEPTEQEKEEGLKIPTSAHKAIAKLISLGYVKVVITTNFDRLTEKALEEEGITPVVISTPDMALGSSPLHHNKCTIIKVNGDYLDSRMRNTTDELKTYEKQIDNLLEQVFNEYGLIISGWSGDWDIGLVTALNRRSNRRFSSYWTTRGELSESGKRLVTQQSFDVITIIDADSFFTELLEKVIALHDVNAVHPISPAIASATVKKYLVDEKQKIRLSDYVFQEAKNLADQLSTKNFPLELHGQIVNHEISSRTKKYETLIPILQAMFIVSFYWGKPEQLQPFMKAFSLIVNPARENGIVDLINLSYYPALLLFYSAGIAAIANNNYKSLYHLFSVPMMLPVPNGEKVPVAYFLHTNNVIPNSYAKLLRANTREYTPMSMRLFEVLKLPLSEVLVSEEEYQSAFDRFEYLLALSSTDLRLQANENGWGSLGQFSWRKDVLQEFLEEYSIHKENWVILKAGFFGGSPERFLAARLAMENYIRIHRFI